MAACRDRRSPGRTSRAWASLPLPQPAGGHFQRVPSPGLRQQCGQYPHRRPSSSGLTARRSRARARAGRPCPVAGRTAPAGPARPRGPLRPVRRRRCRPAVRRPDAGPRRYRTRAAAAGAGQRRTSASRRVRCPGAPAADAGRTPRWRAGRRRRAVPAPRRRCRRRLRRDLGQPGRRRDQPAPPQARRERLAGRADQRDHVRGERPAGSRPARGRSGTRRRSRPR